MRRRDLDELADGFAQDTTPVHVCDDDMLAAHQPSPVPSLLEQFAARATQAAPLEALVVAPPATGVRDAAWLADFEAEFDERPATIRQGALTSAIREGEDNGTPSTSQMAMVALYPSPGQAQRLAHGGGEVPERLHMTLGYLGKRPWDPHTINRVGNVVRSWASNVGPLGGVISGSGVFTEGPDGPVTYLSVDLPALPGLREDLIRRLDRIDVPVSRDHGYTPHITIAYGTPDGYQPPRGEAITFDQVTVAVGDQRWDFPLAGADPSGLQEADALQERWTERLHPRWPSGNDKGGEFASAVGVSPGVGPVPPTAVAVRRPAAVSATPLAIAGLPRDVLDAMEQRLSDDYTLRTLLSAEHRKTALGRIAQARQRSQAQRPMTRAQVLKIVTEDLDMPHTGFAEDLLTGVPASVFAAEPTPPKRIRLGEAHDTSEVDMREANNDMWTCPNCGNKQASETTHCVACGHKLREAQLSAKARRRLPDSAFAIPGERKYPVHDAAHRRNALARVAQHGTPAQKRRVRRAVAKRAREAGIDVPAGWEDPIVEAAKPTGHERSLAPWEAELPAGHEAFRASKHTSSPWVRTRESDDSPVREYTLQRNGRQVATGNAEHAARLLREGWTFVQLAEVEQARPGTNWTKIPPKNVHRLQPIIDHYKGMVHPFGTCVRDQLKHGLSRDHAERRCAVVKDLGRKTTKWRGQEAAVLEAAATAMPAKPPVRPEDDPNFNWRREGGKRGVVLKDGTRRVVDAEMFDRLKRAGMLDENQTPPVRGDIDEPDLELIDGYLDDKTKQYHPPQVYSSGDTFELGDRVTGFVGQGRVVGKLDVDRDGVVTVAGRKVTKVAGPGEHLTAKPPRPRPGDESTIPPEQDSEDAGAADQAVSEASSTSGGTRPRRPPGHPDYNWRRDSPKGRRSVIMSNGQRRVVNGPQYDYLRRAGALSRENRTLRGDNDTTAPAGGGRGQVRSHMSRSPSGGLHRVRQYVRQGDRGDTVKAIQHKVGATPDGAYGPRTRAAVRTYQRQHGLQVDGIVGKQTASAMLGNKSARSVAPGAMKPSQHRRLFGARPKAKMKTKQPVARVRGGTLI